MNTDNVNDDRELQERAKLLFEQSVARLDAGTRSRLTQARYRALGELKGSDRSGAWRSSWVPAGAAATALLAVLVLWQGQPGRGVDGSFDVAAADDLEMLLGEEELDMIQELEFYAWLEEQAEFSSPAGSEDGIG